MIEISNLKLSLQGEEILKGASLKAESSSITTIVGESGAGKTMLLSSIIGLIPHSAKTTGSIIYKGKNLLELSYKERESMRGRTILMMGQNPISAFNPVYKIEHQIKLMLKKNKRDYDGIDEMLSSFSLSKRVLTSYPSELSGGTLQRIALALSLLIKPDVMLLDEGTNALDSTLERSVYEYIAAYVKESGTTLISVSHNIRSALYISDKIAVMKGGIIVEESNPLKLYHNPKHPYSKELLNASKFIISDLSK